MITALVRWLLRGASRGVGRPAVGPLQLPSPEDDRGAGI
jgi:hypothetical protein